MAPETGPAASVAIDGCAPAFCLKEGTVDLRSYFQKIRTIEAAIAGEHTVVVSLETPDGGRAGQLSEVSRAVAAKLVVQGKARLANEREADEFAAAIREAKKAADELSMRDRVQLSVLHEADVELLRSVLRREE